MRRCGLPLAAEALRVGIRIQMARYQAAQGIENSSCTAELVGAWLPALELMDTEGVEVAGPAQSWWMTPASPLDTVW
jgi:hypothetical protein